MFTLPTDDLEFSTRTRMSIVLLAVLVVAVRALRWHLDGVDPPSDFGQIWGAASILRAGGNPYALIGPGRAFEWFNGFYYPLPAAILALPLASLSWLQATAVASAVTAALLAWMWSRSGLIGILLLVSPSVLMAVAEAQWSAFFTAALIWPVLGFLLPAKPTIGAAVFAARPSWRAFVGSLALIAISLAVQPDWPREWLSVLRETRPANVTSANGGVPYPIPILHPLGWLVLLTLSRWRRADARLLLFLACVPQSLRLYETVPLLLLVQTRRQALWFVLAGYIVFGAARLGPQQSVPWADLPITTPLILLLFYLPATLIVLRRPNVGLVPEWIERAAVRLHLPPSLIGHGPTPPHEA
jgi:hypothetical protein